MDVIDQIRDFNRFYTGALGILSRSYLDSGRSLAEVRILNDLASGSGATARQMARALNMDEGQVSRMLARFVAEGLLERRRDQADRRQAVLTLTAAGRALAAGFAQASRDALAALVPDVARQIALAGHLAAARSVIAPLGELGLRSAEPGDGGWIIAEHGRLYARDEGYDQSFEAMVARILADALDGDPKRTQILIAERDGQRLGSITCVPETATTARLRLFIVVPQARGLGVGQMLHDACIGFAKVAGYTDMVLLTHESHQAATRLYARNGWKLQAARPCLSHGQSVVEQDWARAL